MSEKPHFSNNVLTASERAQRFIGKTTIGRAVTKAISGSNYRYYHQLDWQTANSSVVDAAVEVEGDEHAGKLPRFWSKAMIMAFSKDALDELQRTNFRKPQRQAVAYMNEGVVHVGTTLNRNYLFAHFSRDEYAIAMRIGKGPLEASAGLWLPFEEQDFKSVPELRIVEESIEISDLSLNYPTMLLV